MKLEVQQTKYKMDHTHRGRAVIFDHINFPRSDKRTGSDLDAARLKRVLERMRFTVEVHTDLTCSGVKSKIEALAKQDYSDWDCVLVTVLTHGSDTNPNYFEASDGEYDHSELWKPFIPNKCSSLKDKPKLFFFEACRGEKTDPGFPASSKTEHVPDGGPYRTPLMADFFMAYSSVPEYISWRDPYKGSWFIQSLCEVLEQHPDLELHNILTRVHNKVAEFESVNISHKNSKQVPQTVHTLTCELFFQEKPPSLVETSRDSLENSLISNNKCKNKNNKKSETNAPLAVPGGRLASRSREDQHDIFARNVATKLRQLPAKQRLYAEKMINDTLSSAELGKLKEAHINLSAQRKRMRRGARRGGTSRSSTSRCQQKESQLSSESGPRMEVGTGQVGAE